MAAQLLDLAPSRTGVDASRALLGRPDGAHAEEKGPAELLVLLHSQSDQKSESRTAVRCLPPAGSTYATDRWSSVASSSSSAN